MKFSHFWYRSFFPAPKKQTLERRSNIIEEFRLSLFVFLRLSFSPLDIEGKTTTLNRIKYSERNQIDQWNSIWRSSLFDVVDYE